MTSHSSDTGSRSILDEDGKLSSASAATSLKYAKPQDLPSFPSAGLKMSSAGAAASLASSNRKSFEHWKPEPIPAANKAALLAKDYEMEPLWQPHASAAGSKAAMLAAQNNTSRNNKPPSATDSHSRTLANSKPISTTAPTPAPTPYVSEETHKKALMAATASHNRRRSGSLPQPVAKPAQDNSSGWALKAATQSHKAAGPTSTSGAFTTGDPGFEAARIQNMAKNNVDRALYTSAPPVAIEVQEKNRQAMLKASAIAMAQKMYAIQQRQFDDAAKETSSSGQALAASRARSSTVTGSEVSNDEARLYAGGYDNLEEAARKLAQERLAKIHDEHAEYRNYYVQQASPPRSRLSTRMRGRATSNENPDDSDEEDSKKIRSQMSIFQSKLAEVDNKKRRQDRDNLLEIAHRNVDAKIRQMDDNVFQQTGKASQSQMEQWEKSAREKAQKDSDERMQYAGKVHIGGGKYLEQSELDAIARARLQPTLDEISEKAERMRAKDEADRLERERLAAEAQAEKVRQAETAAALKKVKEQQKQEERAKKDEEKRVLREQQAVERQKRDEEKRVMKERQAVEKQKQDEEKRILKEQQLAEKEKRKSKETKPGRLSTLFGSGGGAATAAATGATGAETSAAGDLERTDTMTSIPYEELPDGTFHDRVTSPTALAEKSTVVSQGSTYDQVTSPVASPTHKQVTSPVTSTATQEQVTLPMASSATHEDFTPAIAAPAAEEQDVSPTGLKSTPDPEPSTASPSNVQTIPTTATTTASTTTEAPRKTVGGEIVRENRKSVDSTASPSNVQNLPTSTTTTATTPAEEPRKTVGGEVVRENRKSVDGGADLALSPTKSSSRIKSWMKGKFGSKSTAAESTPIPRVSTYEPPASTKKDEAGLETSSMHDVAMAGKGKTNESEDMYGPDKEVSPVRDTATSEAAHRSPSISSLSSSNYSGEASVPRKAQALNVAQHDSDGESRGRQGFKQRVLQKVKPKSTTTDSAEPVASNTTEDEFEEARDTFEEEKLAPPPPLSTVTGEEDGTKALSPKNSKEGSRFTEEL